LQTTQVVGGQPDQNRHTYTSNIEGTTGRKKTNSQMTRFPTTFYTKLIREEKALKEAEEKAQKEAEEKAQKEAEEKAQKEVVNIILGSNMKMRTMAAKDNILVPL
jgi:hypothetical protein